MGKCHIRLGDLYGVDDAVDSELVRSGWLRERP